MLGYDAHKHDRSARNLNPAYSVVCRFGGGNHSRGVEVLSEGLGRSPMTIYRWSYPRTASGYDGNIPRADLPHVLRLAVAHDVPVSLREIDPELAAALDAVREERERRERGGGGNPAPAEAALAGG